MELIVFHQLVVNGMGHLSTWSHMDSIWYDPDFNKVHSHVTNPVPDVLDFQSENSYVAIKDLCLAETTPKFCVGATAFGLEFLFIPLFYKDDYQGMVRIGPYITSPITDVEFSRLMDSSQISLKDQIAFRHYYETLDLIANQVDLGLGHIAMNLFGYTLPRVEYTAFQETHDKVQPIVDPVTADDTLDRVMLMYDMEHRLMQAIATSNRALLDEFINTNLMAIADRHPENPLRSAKNLAIVVNTILRHAAESGGLHPFYIDNISRKYAILIEKARTRTEVSQLQFDMYEGYFNEVKNHVYQVNSPFIKQVIDYIQLNLDTPLTAGDIAEHFHVKPSNLANQFKHETGYTITEFMNKLRIEAACHYLKNTDLKISEVSEKIGYQDANYFTRTFKKIMDMSPSHYRNNQ